MIHVSELAHLRFAVARERESAAVALARRHLCPDGITRAPWQDWSTLSAVLLAHDLRAAADRVWADGARYLLTALDAQWLAARLREGVPDAVRCDCEAEAPDWLTLSVRFDFADFGEAYAHGPNVSAPFKTMAQRSRVRAMYTEREAVAVASEAAHRVARFLEDAARHSPGGRVRFRDERDAWRGDVGMRVVRPLDLRL